MHVFGSNELVEDVLKTDLCVGCGACVNLCPYYKTWRGKTARLFPCDLPRGRCHAYCPKAEVDLDELSRKIWQTTYDGSPLGNHRKIIAARAGEKMLPGAFQAGGTVSALVTVALRNGLIDAVALTDRQGLTPVARLITDWREVVNCAGTKLMAAPTLAAVNEAVGQGRRRLGVVGTACQMTAVAQMRTNPLEEEDFSDPIALAVGLFCNWSLDTRQLQQFLSAKIDLAAIRGMDVPPPPADILVLTTDTGTVEIPLSQIKPIIAQTCFTCPDMTAEFADVSVGMFEGRPGWNTVIVRSDKGTELIKKAHDQKYLETEAMPEENIAHLSRAAAEKKARALRMLMRRNLLNNKNGRHAAVRMPAEIVERILRG
jgi:coenzyme F420 hydrogenase subunit beta